MVYGKDKEVVIPSDAGNFSIAEFRLERVPALLAMTARCTFPARHLDYTENIVPTEAIL
jgi:hypothetical protein